ncbi:hypothetical protein [Trinickia acidisoli]|uniref:hypothetical protein n=1 Tax=Trinickia acidisoli TaxID=2767482 RepID=UPI001A8C8BD9|nr:hypothetical protein [Trinickia acidisoli]
MNGSHSRGCLDQHSTVELIDKLTLEDQGQLLKTLYVVEGVIVYSGIVQRLFWERRSLAAESFAKGAILKLNERDAACFQYRIAGVTRIMRVPRYAAWLEQVDQFALIQWNEYAYTKRSGAHMPGDSWIEPYLEGLSPAEALAMEMQAASMWCDGPASVSGAANAACYDHISPSRFVR